MDNMVSYQLTLARVKLNNAVHHGLLRGGGVWLMPTFAPTASLKLLLKAKMAVKKILVSLNMIDKFVLPLQMLSIGSLTDAYEIKIEKMFNLAC